MRSTDPDDQHGAAGFTLLEVLIALAIVATSITAIGALVSHNIRTTKAIDDKVALVETTRSILTGLPDRSQFVPGHLDGEVADYQWRIDMTPFAAPATNPKYAPEWVPETLALTVQGPSGQTLRVDTIRLHRQGSSQ